MSNNKVHSSKIFRAIGLMSGTSLDGEIDVALIETDGFDHVKALDFYTHSCGGALTDVVRACFGKRTPDRATETAQDFVTQAHVQAVLRSGFKADVIGFHGQTITHAPEDGFTWQLGNGMAMAAATGMNVVADFRSNDVKSGGQGAPLAPLYHRAIMAQGEEKGPVAVLNLGGVANVSYIGGQDDTLLAFDCGPANALMDDYMKRHTGQRYDAGGAFAASGSVDEEALAQFLRYEFFALKPPKSLDRNHFAAVMETLPGDPADAMASLAEMSAAGVEAALTHMPEPPVVWYICGGGRRNDYLMKVLARRLAPARVEPIESAGWNGDAIEAQCFAYLAVRSLLDEPLSLPSTTGASEPVSGGVLYRAV